MGDVKLTEESLAAIADAWKDGKPDVTKDQALAVVNALAKSGFIRLPQADADRVFSNAAEYQAWIDSEKDVPVEDVNAEIVSESEKPPLERYIQNPVAIASHFGLDYFMSIVHGVGEGVAERGRAADMVRAADGDSEGYLENSAEAKLLHAQLKAGRISLNPNPEEAKDDNNKYLLGDIIRPVLKATHEALYNSKPQEATRAGTDQSSEQGQEAAPAKK